MTARFPASSGPEWRDFEKAPGHVVELQMCCLDGTAHALERRLILRAQGRRLWHSSCDESRTSTVAMPVSSRRRNDCQRLLTGETMSEHRRAGADFRDRPLSGLDVIFTRRSVRAYTPQKLDESTIKSLLDAAVQAPTAMHMEPWAFVVLQDVGMLKRYSDRAKGSWAKDAEKYRDLHAGVDADSEKTFAERFASPDFCIFYDANTLIVICARPMGPFVAADCWLAAENLMLAAGALGLGTCCIGSAIRAQQSRHQIRAENPSRRRSCRADHRRGSERTDGETPRKDPEILFWK